MVVLDGERETGPAVVVARQLDVADDVTQQVALAGPRACRHNVHHDMGQTSLLAFNYTDKKPSLDQISLFSIPTIPIEVIPYIEHESI